MVLGVQVDPYIFLDIYIDHSIVFDVKVHLSIVLVVRVDLFIVLGVRVDRFIDLFTVHRLLEDRWGEASPKASRQVLWHEMKI